MMNEAQTVNDKIEQEPQGQESDQPSPEPSKKRKFLGRTRRVTRFVLAVDAWKRQAQILNGRIRFPLLRRVLSQEIKRRSQHILLSEIDEKSLESSKIGHALILAIMIPCFIWALITITRGLAAAIKFDIIINSGLITGLPFAAFTGAKLTMSYLSYRAISGELRKRSLSDNVETEA